MKLIHILLFCLIPCINIKAQFNNPIYAQNFTLNSIQPWLTNSGLNSNGSYNLYSYLNLGYDVIVCFDMAWSGPSWTYHTSNALKSLYEQHGPLGHPGVSPNSTNDLMVIWIDVDANSSSDSCLLGQIGGCFGNWLNPNNTGQINYPMINCNANESNNLFNNYPIEYAPMMYKICSNRQTTLLPLNQNATQLYTASQSCPISAVNGIDANYFGYLGKETVCYQNYFPKIIVQNNGTTQLSNVTIDVSLNGTILSTGNYQLNLNTYDTTIINCNPIINFNGGNLTINVYNLLDQNLTNNNGTTTVFGANTTTTQSITTNITTDAYGSETIWFVEDLNNNIVFQGGPYLDLSAAGTISQPPVYIQLNPNQCYKFKITDLFGDGMCCFYGNGGFNVKDATNATIITNTTFGTSLERMFRTGDCGVQIQTINTTSCDNYISPNGMFYTISGNYLELVPNLFDCPMDSLLISLQINNSTNSLIYDTVCGGPYLWNNQTYNTSGNYTQTFQAQNGCDSVVTLHLVIHSNIFNPTFSSTQQLFTSPPFAVQFTNSTVNPANYNFTWYWGDGTYTSSNNSSVFHQYLNNGLYKITLDATNITTGCTDLTTLTDYIFTTGGVNCTHSATINQIGPIVSCSGQSVILSCNSNSTFTYQWVKNGVYISGNNNDTLIVTQPGSYSVIISENGCPVSSGQVSVSFSSITLPVVTSSGSIQPCIGGSVTLNAPAGFTSYLWNNGATTQSTIINSSGNYSVQVTNLNGCQATSIPYTINASILPSQNICVVGVDSITNNIRVVWEEPNTTAIDSFYIYKESNVTNVYTQVGSRSYDSLSVWIDPISNPAVQSYRYKITALDTCGAQTPLSGFHKTIHLTINQGVGGAWNLIWSHYEGINFGSYNIYRGTAPNSMVLLTSIQSNLNSYTDLTAPVGNIYYQIEIINPNICTPSKSTNYSSSKSNVVTNNSIGIYEGLNTLFKVYPNPANKEINILTDSRNVGSPFELIDFTGRKVLSGKIESENSRINIEGISIGNYLLNIGIGSHIKIVIE